MERVAEFEDVCAHLAPGVVAGGEEPSFFQHLEHILRHGGVPYRLADLMWSTFAPAELVVRGDQASSDIDRDLILNVPNFDFYEVVLRDAFGRSRSGGWLTGSDPVRITEETVAGHRVILTRLNGTDLRHEYRPDEGYRPIFGDRPAPLSAAQRIALERSQPG